ncbi:MAG: hypothetical protein LDL19_08030 [Thiobacillus sp.]|nr:hypothetical protein [Thiobacillus sp.]
MNLTRERDTRPNPPLPLAEAPLQTQASSAIALLVAALATLHRPCARNRAAARLLLGRAARHGSLTSVERELCRVLADELDTPALSPQPAHRYPAPRAAGSGAS